MKTVNQQKRTLLFWVATLLLGCTAGNHPVGKHAKHYRKHGDAPSLAKVVEWVPLGTDTADVRRLLGEPIDMGFDFRYLIDSTGETGCQVGAVFHIDDQGKIDDKWIGEICE